MKNKSLVVLSVMLVFAQAAMGADLPNPVGGAPASPSSTSVARKPQNSQTSTSAYSQPGQVVTAPGTPHQMIFTFPTVNLQDGMGDVITQLFNLTVTATEEIVNGKTTLTYSISGTANNRTEDDRDLIPVSYWQIWMLDANGNTLDTYRNFWLSRNYCNSRPINVPNYVSSNDVFNKLFRLRLEGGQSSSYQGGC